MRTFITRTQSNIKHELEARADLLSQYITVALEFTGL